MFFDEMRDRCVEALGEYDNQDVAGSTAARHGNAVILRRLKSKYLELLKRGRQRNPRYFMSEVHFTYTASARSVSLTTIAAPTVLRHAEFQGMFTVGENGLMTELGELSSEEFFEYNMTGNWPPSLTGLMHYFLLGDDLYLLPELEGSARVGALR